MLRYCCANIHSSSIATACCDVTLLTRRFVALRSTAAFSLYSTKGCTTVVPINRSHHSTAIQYTATQARCNEVTLYCRSSSVVVSIHSLYLGNTTNGGASRHHTTISNNNNSNKGEIIDEQKKPNIDNNNAKLLEDKEEEERLLENVEEIVDVPSSALKDVIDISKYTDPIPISMPDLGTSHGSKDRYSMVQQWYFSKGDIIQHEDVLCDITTPDFTFGMETDDEGITVMGDILVPINTPVPDGTILCYTLHESKGNNNDNMQEAVVKEDDDDEAEEKEKELEQKKDETKKK